MSLRDAARKSRKKAHLGAKDTIATMDYSHDVWERSILFWDTLRQRADNMLEHERAGLPPLLNFKYEMISDARRSERPANYALLRILEIYALLRILEIGDVCWKDCVDPNKPTVIVFDRRAGPAQRRSGQHRGLARIRRRGTGSRAACHRAGGLAVRSR